MSPSAELRTTPLTAVHRSLNARLGPFAGWEMPMQYAGIASEHSAVRRRAGLFDVSHMGEIEVAGKHALEALQRLTSNDPARLDAGQAQYSALLTPEGTFVDDMLVYRLAPSHFMLVVNAANTAKDLAWLTRHVESIGDVAVVDSSSRYALLAVQGPLAREVLQPLTGIALGEMGRHSFAHGEVASALATVSRTGYTGEDGFEIFVQPRAAVPVWRALLESGASAEMVPCGLGARDTLRLEAGMRLYGCDIDESTSVLEAGLGWMVAWGKPTFLGRDRLLEEKAAGPRRRLVGFELLDPGIARQGHQVVDSGTVIGEVTSGTKTPWLDKAIGMAYVPSTHASPGRELHVDIRGRLSRARIVPLPFYTKAQ